MNMINLNKLTNLELINEIYELRSQLQLIKDSVVKRANELKDDIKSNIIDELRAEKEELLNKIETLIEEKEQAIQQYINEQSKKVITILFERITLVVVNSIN